MLVAPALVAAAPALAAGEPGAKKSTITVDNLSSFQKADMRADTEKRASAALRAVRGCAAGRMGREGGGLPAPPPVPLLRCHLLFSVIWPYRINCA